MRCVSDHPYTREQCERRALDLEWHASNAQTPYVAAQAWDEARWWRSLALVAQAKTVK